MLATTFGAEIRGAYSATRDWPWWRRTWYRLTHEHVFEHDVTYESVEVLGEWREVTVRRCVCGGTHIEAD